MSDAAPTPATSDHPPWWVRLLPYYGLAFLIALIFFFDRVLRWLEEDLGLGFVWALVVLLVSALVLVGVPAWAVLAHEHRRNR
jgi:hypothetical protein